jgi:hypothetical protein
MNAIAWHYAVPAINWRPKMLQSKRAFAQAAIVAVTGLGLIAATAPAQAACINKAGEGTNTTVDGAKFQAYEAVLQATDWGMWSQWMASSQKVGVAPGYQVKNVKANCKAGGLGQTCIVQATLCK